MTLPSSGAIAMSQINSEFGLSPTTSITLGDVSVRRMFNKTSGAISLFDGYNMGVPRSGLLLYHDPYLPVSYSGSGTSINDLSDVNNDGTLQASPPFTSSPGYFNFTTASSQYISTAIAYTFPSVAVTACAWFRTTSTLGRKIIGFESDQTGTASASYDKHLYVDTAGKVRWGIYDGTTAHMAVSTAALNDNVWHFVVGTYGGEGTTLRLYVNGASNATTTSSTANWLGPGYWRMGGYKLASWTGGSNGFYTGDIGPCMAYNRSLSAAEILQIFNYQRVRFGV